MKARSIILAVAGAVAVMAAIPTAEAGGYNHDGHGRGYRGGYGGYERPNWRPPHHRPHWQPYGYYAPPPVYYPPPPVYYAPPRHYGYAPPPEVYFGFRLN